MISKYIYGKMILPFCPSYPKARLLFNRSINKYPSAIIYCNHKEDVVQAVRYAGRRGDIIRIRSGGHNYEGFCIGNNKLTIDTSHIKGIQFSNRTNTIKIGSGITNKELYGFLKQYGYPFPSGTCPTVNAVGLTQGGGWGHSARMFGLACDSLVEAELVDACGNFITASKTSHPDLFWALQGGGGGNLGVITSLSYHVVPKAWCVTYVNLQYSGIDEFTAFQFFKAWQEWAAKEEIRFTPNSRIYNSEQEGMGIFLRGFFYGTPKEAAVSLQPFMQIGGAEVSLQYVTFWEATEIDASFYPSFEKFRFAGRFAYGCFTDSQIHAILQLIKNRARGAAFASVAVYAMGGIIRRIHPWETAFYYRNANFIIGIETVWKETSAQCDNLAWIFSRYQCLHCLTNGSYINFPYLNTENYMRAYYGENACRLIEVKKQYDPNNLFCFPQSIRPW